MVDHKMETVVHLYVFFVVIIQVYIYEIHNLL